jgi:hypothetical protein
VLSTIFRIILFIEFVCMWMGNGSAPCVQSERDSNLVNWPWIGPNYAGFRCHSHGINTVDLFIQPEIRLCPRGSGVENLRWCRASVIGILSKSAT